MSYYDALLSKKVVITPERERELIERAQNGDESAINGLLQAHIRLIQKSVSGLLKSHDAKITFEDLMQEGIIGFIEGIKKFDLEKDFRLMTFANWHVQNRIKKYIFKNTGLWRNNLRNEAQKAFWGLSKFHDEFIKENGRLPTNEEAAKHFGLKETDIVNIETNFAPWSLNQNVSLDEYSSVELIETIVDPNPVNEDRNLMDENVRKVWQMVLERCKEKDRERIRDIIQYRFIDGMNQKETFEAMGVSRSYLQKMEPKIQRMLIKFLSEYKNFISD